MGSTPAERATVFTEGREGREGEQGWEADMLAIGRRRIVLPMTGGVCLYPACEQRVESA